MIRALAVALLLAACASQPDPLAFATPQPTLPRQLFASLPPLARLDPPRAYPLTDPPDLSGVLLNDPPITAICRNGWVSYSQHRRGTCSGKGGVRDWVNPPE